MVSLVVKWGILSYLYKCRNLRKLTKMFRVGGYENQDSIEETKYLSISILQDYRRL